MLLPKEYNVIHSTPLTLPEYTSTSNDHIPINHSTTNTWFLLVYEEALHSCIAFALPLSSN